MERANPPGFCSLSLMRKTPLALMWPIRYSSAVRRLILPQYHSSDSMELSSAT